MAFLDLCFHSLTGATTRPDATTTTPLKAPFFAGPAFLTWSRSQGTRGWGGPLPHGWIEDHRTLQQQILVAMRAFGMKPILPAFQGYVPLPFMAKFPHANVARVGKPPLCAGNGTSVGEYSAALLQPTDAPPPTPHPPTTNNARQGSREPGN